MTDPVTLPKIFRGYFRLLLISRIRDYRDYHSQAFDGVKDTVYAGTDLKDFDFYFDYVVSRCKKLKPLWEE